MLLISSRRWISNYKKKRHVCKFVSIMTDAREKSGKYLSKMEDSHNYTERFLCGFFRCPVEEVNPILTSSRTI
ncbi:unnamed protein product [Brassica napus]|uniref:(rape) hypothetical protein n=1 Tax=Brassica napus TaxID=3708 RepID=A0A816KKE9_BRANA|nr:unnamed protein product [Brassica napus]